MRLLIVGRGAQAELRTRVAQAECVINVDRNIQEVPVQSYDAALICTSDENKHNLIRYALANKKHVIVEAPLWCNNSSQIDELSRLAKANNVILYTAYNCRFEPNIVRLQQLIINGALGKIYHARVFYGAKNTEQMLDPVTEIGAQILDMLYFCFGPQITQQHFSILRKKRLISAMPEHVIMGDLNSDLSIEMEINLLSWRNSFSCDIYGEFGSAHIDSLCRWGKSTFVQRQFATFDDYQPIVNSSQEDPDLVWELEYAHFKQLCMQNIPVEDFAVSHWVLAELRRLSKEELLLA